MIPFLVLLTLLNGAFALAADTPGLAAYHLVLFVLCAGFAIALAEDDNGPRPA